MLTKESNGRWSLTRKKCIPKHIRFTVCLVWSGLLSYACLHRTSACDKAQAVTSKAVL